RKKQKDYISRYTNAALSDLSLHTNAVLDMGTTLVENMLVGHHTPIDGTTQNDIWYTASKSHAVRHQSESYRPYERDFNSHQIGIRHQEGVFGYGGALTHTKSLAKLTDDMQAKHDSTLLSGFAQYHHDNATIVVDAGIGNIRADIETIKNSRRIVSAGLAAKYQFGQDIQVIPSIYVRHNWIQGTAYQLDGADIVLDKVNSNQAGADVRVQKTIRSGAFKITPSIYVGSRFVSSKAGVMVNNQHFGQSIGNSHHIGGGVNVSYDRFTAGFDVKQRHGDEFDKQSQADISMSYHW
ncbi:MULTISPECIES: hypothetical protein, partial [unclassified Moraxella]|uniref:hypothetical protein n=1 Tax=unclassified Moraxella TaxID=2685852 RepID=UPI002B40F0F5